MTSGVGVRENECNARKSNRVIWPRGCPFARGCRAGVSKPGLLPQGLGLAPGTGETHLRNRTWLETTSMNSKPSGQPCTCPDLDFRSSSSTFRLVSAPLALSTSLNPAGLRGLCIDRDVQSLGLIGKRWEHQSSRSKRCRDKAKGVNPASSGGCNCDR